MPSSNILNDKYEINKNDIIGYGPFGSVYKAKNLKNNLYYAIKMIDKQKFKYDINNLKDEIEKMKKIGTDNSLYFIETIDTKSDFCIVMELCECNLDDYLKKRENKITINELREVLIQLNNTFKIMRTKSIIRADLNPRNILISLNRLDKCLIRLSDYGKSKFINLNDSVDKFFQNKNTIAPEILENGFDKLSEKSQIWSLGMTIYYLLFKEYPYNGNTEYEIFNDIKSNKILKKTDTEDLNNLLNRMLKIKPDDRISWDDYFNHSFFKNTGSLVDFPKFNFECQKHSRQICYYCENCKRNICEVCLSEEPYSHKIISISKIGLTEDEINKFNHFKNEIKNNLNNFKNMIDNTDVLLNRMKEIKINTSIYQNDSFNNYKKYYFDCYDILNQQLKNKINLINMNVSDNSEKRKRNSNSNSNSTSNSNNEIICEYIIDDSQMFSSTQIINCFENAFNEDNNLEGINNKKDIENNCELYLNDEKIQFSFRIAFKKKGINKIKMVFNTQLTNLNFMFHNCKSLKSIDFSNFDFSEVSDISYMFSYCQSLTSINFRNINTSKLVNMARMFNCCDHIKKIDLSPFNTINVRNMKYMFSYCIKLEEVNLFNFKTNNVNDMNNMFNNCTHLKNLNLSNFDTTNVINMANMFCNCSSLQNLDLSSFNTNNVKNTTGMLYKINTNCNIKTSDKKIIDLIKKK